MSERKSNAELMLVRLLARLPFPVVRALAGGLAWLLSWLPLSWVSAHRDVLVNYLACFPELDWRTARHRARAAFVQTARTLAGFSHVWLRPMDETFSRIRAVQGEHEFRAALEADAPVLLLSLHQSAWEVPLLVLGRLAPAVVMYQPAEHTLDEVVRQARERTGCVLVPADGHGVRSALAELEHGGVFALLADHQPGGKSNPRVPFFGHPVPVPAFVHKVVERYRPQVFFLSARYPETDGTYEVHFERVLGDLQDMDERVALTAMMQGLEAIIRREPLQYHWTYNRFRRSAGGKRNWYKKDVALSMLRRVRSGEPAAEVFCDTP